MINKIEYLSQTRQTASHSYRVDSRTGTDKDDRELAVGNCEVVKKERGNIALLKAPRQRRNRTTAEN